MKFFRVNDENPLTGWHMLAIVGVFFGVIIAVNLVMAYVAVGSFPGLTVKNSYVASQRHNELMERARAQEAMGWTSSIRADGDGLHVALKDAEGRPLRRLDVSLRLGRPASAREDRIVELDAAPAGYRSPEVLGPGRWVAELAVHDRGDLVYRRTETLLVEAAGS